MKWSDSLSLCKTHNLKGGSYMVYKNDNNLFQTALNYSRLCTGDPIENMIKCMDWILKLRKYAKGDDDG